MTQLVRKIEAGALQYAIAISIVIGGILAAFLLYTHIQLKLSKQSNWASTAIAVAEDGVRYSHTQSIAYSDSLFLQRGDKTILSLQKEHWGIYDILSSTGKSHTYSHTIKSLTGNVVEEGKRLALHMDNDIQPLVVVGNTGIFGNVQLAESGVKPGAIAGTYFQGDKLIYGNEGRDFSELPAISEEKYNYLQDLINGTIPNSFKKINLLKEKHRERSFNETTSLFYSRDEIYLDQHSLAGNIMIISKKRIRVSAFAKAQHILLIAPEIQIETGAEVQLQAFASKRIILEEGSSLLYPSALVLFSKDVEDNHKFPKITLQERAVVEGSVVLLQKIKQQKKQTDVLIATTAQVYGEVYCEGYLEHKGEVYGSVYTDYFAVNEKGSFYINHLKNGVIDSRNTPPTYGGIIGDGNKQSLIWLD